MRHAWMELSPDNNIYQLLLPYTTETIDYKHIAGFVGHVKNKYKFSLVVCYPKRIHIFTDCCIGTPKS